MKSFKQYLLESQGIYDAMGDSIKQRIAAYGAEYHPKVKLTRKNIRKHNMHDVLLHKTGIRSDITPFSQSGFPEEGVHNYHFTIPSAYPNSRKDHKVHVKFVLGKGSLMAEKPMTYETSFAIDGSGGVNQLPPDAHAHQHAVYAGVMDAVAHHAIQHGTEPNDYEFDGYAFTNNARERQRMEKAKNRRYRHMLKSLESIK